MLMVPRNHQLASRSRVEITRLRHETFISGTPDDPNRVALASACAGAGFAPYVAFGRLRGHRQPGQPRLRHRRGAASGLASRHPRVARLSRRASA
jgi:hypothetical protein